MCWLHGLDGVLDAACELLLQTCTLMAFEHFAAAGVKVAVVEVGLGGRLDATNILPPNKHCVVTSIGNSKTARRMRACMHMHCWTSE